MHKIWRKNKKSASGNGFMDQRDAYQIWTLDMEPLKDYIEFFHGNGCFSFAGRDGQRQKITLAAYCAEEHTLIHEVSFFNVET